MKLDFKNASRALTLTLVALQAACTLTPPRYQNCQLEVQSNLKDTTFVVIEEATGTKVAERKTNPADALPVIPIACDKRYTIEVSSPEGAEPKTEYLYPPYNEQLNYPHGPYNGVRRNFTWTYDERAGYEQPESYTCTRVNTGNGKKPMTLECQ